LSKDGTICIRSFFNHSLPGDTQSSLPVPKTPPHFTGGKRRAWCLQERGTDTAEICFSQEVKALRRAREFHSASQTEQARTGPERRPFSPTGNSADDRQRPSLLINRPGSRHDNRTPQPHPATAMATGAATPWNRP